MNGPSLIVCRNVFLASFTWGWNTLVKIEHWINEK